MDDKELLKKRLTELAGKSYKCNCFTFTDFLGMSELAEFYEYEKELKFAHPEVYGGPEGFERGVVRFGNPEELGYEEPFPVAILICSPLQEKFADDLGHRDFLGALMNLGVERSVIGDIIVSGKKAYIFCLERIADYICENITSVKHTSVRIERAGEDELPKTQNDSSAEKRIQVQSERLDAVIAKVMNISRSSATEYFRQQKVFVNGRITENTSYMLKNDDAVTVRGFGRFKFAGIEGTSRKGRLNVIIRSF
ncbi:MAG: YlmH/Sll1252 family protein [Lachnospiraceae bacterium]|nr:YlmH/Sll1252 family protein [Lachnospiraceae bacterium]